MKIVIGARDVSMPHVSRKVREFGVYLCTRGDPSVEICESEMMTKIVRPRLVTKSFANTRSLPDRAERYAYAGAFVTLSSVRREEIDSTRIDIGNAPIVCPEKCQQIL